MRLIDADELIEICRKGWKLFGGEEEKLKHWIDEDDIRNQPTVEAIPVEWFKNFTNNYCDLVVAIDTQFFINEFILKRWKAESEGKDWPQVKNNAEKTYQYLKKLLREGKTLEAAKFVEEKENEQR